MRTRNLPPIPILLITALIALTSLSGCATTPHPDHDILRQAEQAGAKITDYQLATAPAADDVLIGTDISDTSMAPSGTTKRFRLRDLPVSDPAQAALAAKQDTVALASDLEITAGIETTPRLISPAQAKLAAETHGGTSNANYPGVTSDGADGLRITGDAGIAGLLTVGASGPIVAKADCSSEPSGICIDSDDHRIYRWNGTAMVSVGFLPCIPGNGDCGQEWTENTVPCSWTPDAGTYAKCHYDGSEYCYNFTLSAWEQCSGGTGTDSGLPTGGDDDDILVKDSSVSAGAKWIKMAEHPTIAAMLAQLTPYGAISITPDEWAFGGTDVDGDSAWKAFTIRNVGTTAVTLDVSSPVSLTGTNAGMFEIDAVNSTCAAELSLIANDTCDAIVRHSPAAAGAHSANLQIVSNADNSPTVVELSGTGISSAGYIGSDETLVGANTGGGVGARAFKFTTTTPGDISTLTFHIGSWVNADTIYAGIYSHDAGGDQPLNQLAYGALSSGVTAGAKNTITLTAPYSIASSTVYWLVAKVKNGASNAELYVGTSASSGGLIKSYNGDTLNNLPGNGTTWNAGSEDIAIAYGE